MIKTLFAILVLAAAGFGQDFGSDWTTVPKTFKGVDAKAVLKTLLGTPVLKDKDEFETSADYAKRIANIKAISFGGGLTAESILAFRYQSERAGGPTSSYEADSQILTIRIPTERLRYLAANDSGRIEDRMFTGVTIADPELEVTNKNFKEVHHFRQYKLAFNNILQFTKALDGSTGFAYVMKLPAAQAKEVKANLAVLFVTKLAKPFHEAGLTVIKPTLDKLYTLEAMSFYLVADVSEIWLFNAQTGEIYKKIMADKTLDYLEKPTPTPLTNSNVPGISYIISAENSGAVGQQLDKMIEMGKAMVSQNCPKDEAAVLRFVGRDKIDITQQFTANKHDLNDALDNLYIEGGQTALIDAIYLSIENLTYVKTSNRKGVVLMTSGDDSNSYYNEKQLIDLAKKSKVPIYAIAFVDDLSKDGGFTTKSPQSKAKAFLERLTKETGGKVFFPNSASEVAAIGKEILLSLHGGTSSPCH